MYARWNGTNWDAQKVVESNASGPGPLIIDSKGNPHISYRGAMTFDARFYQMYGSTTESTSTLPSQTNIPHNHCCHSGCCLSYYHCTSFSYNRYWKPISQNKPNVQRKSIQLL